MLLLKRLVFFEVDKMKLTKSQALGLFRKKLNQAYRRRKIVNADKHIDRLLKSVNPGQCHDYIMLRYNKRDFPCDAELYGLASKLAKLGFCPIGWNMNTSDKFDSFVCIGFPTKYYTETKVRKNVYAKLTKLFKGLRIVVDDTNYEVLGLARPKVKPNTLVLARADFNQIKLSFKPSMLGQLEKALKVRPTKLAVLPGMKAAKITDNLAAQVHEIMAPPDIQDVKGYNRFIQQQTRLV